MSNLIVEIRNTDGDDLDALNISSDRVSDLIMVAAFISEVTDGVNALTVIDSLEIDGSFYTATVGGSLSFTLTE